MRSADISRRQRIVAGFLSRWFRHIRPTCIINDAIVFPRMKQCHSTDAQFIEMRNVACSGMGMIPLLRLSKIIPATIYF